MRNPNEPTNVSDNTRLIRWLQDIADKDDLIDKVKDTEGYLDLVRWVSQYQPDTSICFGVEYNPIPRELSGKHKQEVDYSEDVCGTQCILGLYKPQLQEGERQGDLACLALKGISEVFGVALPRRENFSDTILVRRHMLRKFYDLVSPLFVSSEPEEKKEEAMSDKLQNLVMQPHWMKNEGCVWDKNAQEYLRHPDGSLVKADEVADSAPAAPPAPPAPVAPAAPVAPVAPAAPVAPVAPATPGMPPAPGKAAPAPVAAAPPVSQSAPAQPHVHAVPETQAIIALIEEAREYQAKAGAALRKAIELVGGKPQTTFKGSPAAAAPSNNATPAAPAASAMQQHTYETLSPEHQQQVNNFRAACQQLGQWNADSFKKEILRKSDDPALYVMCLDLGFDPAKYNPSSFKRSASGAISRKLFPSK